MFKKKRNNFKIDRYYKRLLIGVGALLLVFILIAVTRQNDPDVKVINFSNGISFFFKKEPKREFTKVDSHVSLEVVDEGYNIYVPTSGSAGYQYGPSILMNDDGSLDAWFSSPGNNSSEWDWIIYRHSDDGINWSNDKVVLQPTGDSYDHYSVCDPGVIYFNGYYYLGYTSTLVATDNGINNNVYVARSENPDGPYEKWNGEGWGGSPKPIIYYDESNDQWGAGEVSFVIKDDILYCYYSWHCEHGTYTKVSIAPLTENWPSELNYQGIACEYEYGQDSCDVVYVEEANKFVSFAISDRFSKNSGIVIYESEDGVDFYMTDIIHTNVASYAHNMGITKRLDGHIKQNDEISVAYAYSNRKKSTGIWATRFQNANLIVYQSKQPEQKDKGGDSIVYDDCYSRKANNYIIGISAEPRTINIEVGSSKYINTFAYRRSRSKVSADDLVYEYDDEYVEINGDKLTALKVGQSEVVIYYDDFYTTLTVNIHKENYLNDPEINYIDEFEPVEDNIVLHLNDDNYHTVQIRTFIKFRDGSWGEAYNDFTSKHPRYKAMIPAEEYYIKYDVDDDSIIDIDEESGIIEAKNIGETYVHVYLQDDVDYDLKVSVTD